jgi:hypothetical protein
MATYIMFCQEKFKSAPSAGKVMLTLFWDVNGLVLEHYQESGETFNSVRYRTMLEKKLKPVIHSRCRGLLSEGALLLHDSARPHTAAGTDTAIHPPYSPSLAPSNYHVFDALKEAKQKATKNFFSAGIQKLVERCESPLQRTVTTWENILLEYVYMMCILI